MIAVSGEQVTRPLTVDDMHALKETRSARLKTAIQLGFFPDSTPLLTPVTVLCGAREGPVLWVEATIHGTEIGGLVGLLRLIDRVDPAALAGTLVVVPTVNPAAFRGTSRPTPYDSVNMNRAFPGKADGTFTEQACRRIYDFVLAGADCVLDLHSGGREAIVPHYAIYHQDGSPAGQRARDLVRRLRLDIVWASSEDWLDGALFTVATKAGIPGLIVESGGGTLDDQQVMTFTTSILNLMQALRMLAGPAPEPIEPRLELSGCTFIYCSKGGIYVPEAQAGDVLESGAPIGHVMNLYGEIVETIVVPRGPACLTAVPVPFLPVETGHMIAEAVAVQSGYEGGAS